MKRSVLQRFARELVDDYEKTLGRFLALQFLGSEDQTENLRHARALLFDSPNPDRDMLEQGLKFLEQSDLRDELENINCPVLIINGEHDSLIPVTTARYLTEKIPLARSVVVKGAGHALFLSHHEKFLEYVKVFLNG